MSSLIGENELIGNEQANHQFINSPEILRHETGLLHVLDKQGENEQTITSSDQALRINRTLTRSTTKPSVGN